MRRAVLALPLRYREPVVLFYFHEMDVGAAATHNGDAGGNDEGSAGESAGFVEEAVSAS